MKRLTTDTPKDNFETVLNFVYGKDGFAHIRHDGENADVLLTKWAAEQCISRDGCEDMFQDGVFPEEIDETICDCMMDSPDCPIALAYCFACQAVHLRSRLKMYEDILFSEDGTELVSLDQLREIASQQPNQPMTLEELRKMDGEPVWVEFPKCAEATGWMLVSASRHCVYDGLLGDCDFENCGKTWLAYRRKPEEVCNET